MGLAELRHSRSRLRVGSVQRNTHPNSTGFDELKRAGRGVNSRYVDEVAIANGGGKTWLPRGLGIWVNLWMALPPIHVRAKKFTAFQSKYGLR